MASPRMKEHLVPCEPCRRSKSRCDYAIPTCQKCLRKGKSDLCVYPPTAQAQSWYSEPPPPSSPTTATMTLDHPPTPAKLDSRLSFLPAFPGSMGLMDENHYHSPAGGRASTLNVNGSYRADPTAPDPSHVQLGARLLDSLLGAMSVYEQATETLFRVSPEGNLLGLPVLRWLFTALKDLRDSGSSSSVLSQTFFDETQKPLGIDASTHPIEYFGRVARRWEGIGLIFSVAGAGTMMATGGMNITSDQKLLAGEAAAAADSCLQFCDALGSVNDSLAWLLYQQTSLLILIHGDNDHRPWRKLCDLSAMIFTLGLNMPKANSSLPFFMVELQKRLLTGAYSIDKRLAMSLMRPPQIGARFCNLQFPMDLSYEEILTDSSTRETAISRLDENMWNTQGIIQEAQWFRLSPLIGSIREEFIELSLRLHEGDLAQEVKVISDNSHEIWQSLPDFLCWQPAPGAINSGKVRLISLYLDFLYNDFLLYQVLVRRSRQGSDVLVRVSHDMLSTTVQLLGNEIASGTASSTIGRDILCFGISSAGILALELLSQAQGASPETFRRAEAIQNLTLFAAHLQYVARPGDVRYTICERVGSTVRRVLDKVLSGNAVVLPSSLPVGGIATDWLARERVLLEDGTDLVRWLEE